MNQHRVTFSHGEEFLQRLETFIANDKFIEEHNASGASYTLGHNQFSIYSREEFAEKFLRRIEGDSRVMLRGEAPAAVHTGEGLTAPTSVDWVAKGGVTGVKDQGQCGSCWSFSTTGALEGAYFNKKGSLVSFSEQMLVDCDGFDMGCNGGMMDRAFRWIKNNGGLCTESAYPYVSGTTKKAGTCTKSSCSVVSGSAVTSWTDVTSDDANAMMTAVALQPVSVAIEADQSSFQLYKSGVFTGTCGNTLDHGVLLVGYGADSGQNFWKVKNSWGTSWGEGGYIRMQRGKDQECDQCGILCGASYPTLA